MAEQWRDVSGYDGIYQISDPGHVRNTHTSKILQPIKMRNRKLYITLSSDGFARKMHYSPPGRRGVSRRLSAKTRDNPPRRDCTNNAARNLECLTRGENQKRFVTSSCDPFSLK